MHNLLRMAVIAGVFQQASEAVAQPTAGAAPAQPTATEGTAAVSGTAVAQPAVAPAAPVKAPPPAAPFPGVEMKEVKYHFKKDELGNKRPTVGLYVPTPTWDGLNAALSDETKDEKGVTVGTKVKNLILEMLGNLAADHVRLQVNDEKSPVNKQEELDTSKLSLAFIASIPPSERRGGGISKETWADFFKDYLAVMPEKTGKKPEQVENAAKLFVARLQPVKTQKKILAFLQDMLNLWYTSTTDDSREEFAEVKEFLDGKIAEFLKRDEAELLANL